MNTGTEHISNELLVKRYQNGDEDALQLLIKTFSPKLVRTIYYYTKNQAPVEDLAQECWYSIIEKLVGLELKINFDVWALCIARRKAIDWIRKQQRSREQAQAMRDEAELSAEAKEAEDKEDKLKRLQLGIQQLSPIQRVVLNMYYLENLSVLEISEVLDISKGTVKSRMFYAREKLKEIITQ